MPDRHSTSPPFPVTAFMRIDAVCDRFEDEFRAGGNPRLASYLAGAPDDLLPPLFRNLLSLDFEYRQRRGERPDVERYRKQFPDLGDVVDSVFCSLTHQPISDGVRSPDSRLCEETNLE